MGSQSIDTLKCRKSSFMNTRMGSAIIASIFLVEATNPFHMSFEPSPHLLMANSV